MQYDLPLARHLGGHHDHDHSHPHEHRGGAPLEYSVPLVELSRGGLTESIHRGAVVVCATDGKRQKGAGHPAMPTFLRSAAKPLQVLPLIASGAAAEFNLTSAEIACMCGSLNGEDFQVEAVRSILAKAGLDENLLACGVHKPSYGPAAQALAEKGEKPLPVHNNCAGKHAAMLALCAHLGHPTTGYTEPAHPVQRIILEALSETCAYPAEQIGLGVDGCGVPVYRLPLHALAGAYARLAAPEQSGLKAETMVALRVVQESCLAHPEMIAGTGRLCTRIMQAAPGLVLAKTGAEGSYALALPQAGLGVALQIEDGGMRALAPAVCYLLHQLDVLNHDALDGPLADLCRPQLKNHRGEAVAELKGGFRLS